MQDTDYIKLVLKHLDSEATPAEQAALQHWLEADQQHRLEYQTLERIWRDSGKVLNKHSFDVEAALEKVENRLAIPDALVPRSSMPARLQVWSFPWKWSLAAASVLLVAGTAGWWYLTRPQLNEIHADRAAVRVALPDGSRVHLRQGAVLRYSGSLADGNERMVELSGEAFFEPVHNPARPFHIQTEHAILQDIGTSFLVKDAAATDELTVITGKVKFAEKADPSNSLTLTEGHKAILSGNRFTVSGATGGNVISWTTGILDFKDEPLRDVVADISDFYQTPVVLDAGMSDKARAARVTARFEHQPLKDILEEIRLTTGLSTRKEKGTFVFFQE